jgi:hypothetical protein
LITIQKGGMNYLLERLFSFKVPCGNDIPLVPVAREPTLVVISLSACSELHKNQSFRVGEDAMVVRYQNPCITRMVR